jgi:predicted Zn-dependent protease
VIAFTFGHELSHHYLGHTGCANGDDRPPATLQDLAMLLARGASRVPLFNQPNELAADQWGIINTLETGKARPSTQYRFTERGGLLLLDFFSRIEMSAGMNDPFVAFITSHPNSRFRFQNVQQIAQTWWSQQPR